jgi:lysozyme
MAKKKKKPWKWLYISIILVGIIAIWLVAKFYISVNSLSYYGGPTKSRTESLKFDLIFRNHPDALLGIDVSHYQGAINWKNLSLQIKNRPISFMILRATMGDNNDKLFKKNWLEAGKLPIRKGAYHYYRPNENSTKQAEMFIKAVELRPGDLPPILDIERHSTIQTRDRLREGVRNWLKIVEAHYGVKPMLYTGDNYFKHVFLGEGFEDYPLWVANYNHIQQPESDYWVMWQFSEKGILPGISNKVDLNIIRGGSKTLENLLIK